MLIQNDTTQRELLTIVMPTIMKQALLLYLLLLGRIASSIIVPTIIKLMPAIIKLIPRGVKQDYKLYNCTYYYQAYACYYKACTYYC